MLVSNGLPSLETPSKISNGNACLEKILGGASVAIAENKSNSASAEELELVGAVVVEELDSEAEDEDETPETAAIVDDDCEDEIEAVETV